MKSTKKNMTPQVRFTLALNATWSVLHDPVLTKILDGYAYGTLR